MKNLKSKLGNHQSIAQIVMKSPECKKLIFIVLKERPKEAPFGAHKNSFFERGLVMDSWISFLFNSVLSNIDFA
jgi:phage FluMu protein Com